MILERIEDTPPVCSGCGHVHGRSVHSREIVLVEDLRMSGKRIFLCVSKRKIRCIEDGRIRVEEINWIKGRFTDRFAEQVYRLTSITT
jgi:transposase